jgi:hypothetical protein
MYTHTKKTQAKQRQETRRRERFEFLLLGRGRRRRQRDRLERRLSARLLRPRLVRLARRRHHRRERRRVARGALRRRRRGRRRVGNIGARRHGLHARRFGSGAALVVVVVRQGRRRGQLRRRGRVVPLNVERIVLGRRRRRANALGRRIIDRVRGEEVALRGPALDARGRASHGRRWTRNWRQRVRDIGAVERKGEIGGRAYN